MSGSEGNLQHQRWCLSGLTNRLCSVAALGWPSHSVFPSNFRASHSPSGLPVWSLQLGSTAGVSLAPLQVPLVAGGGWVRARIKLREGDQRGDSGDQAVVDRATERRQERQQSPKTEELDFNEILS